MCENVQIKADGFVSAVLASVVWLIFSKPLACYKDFERSLPTAGYAKPAISFSLLEKEEK